MLRGTVDVRFVTTRSHSSVEMGLKELFAKLLEVGSHQHQRLHGHSYETSTSD